ncbi:MAG TPA: PilZ domain-containing protein [Polyangia bacterium]|nr:PilZ domain-containing protein [Polyangia bacterium]
MKKAKRDDRETTASRRLHPRFQVDVQVSVSADNVKLSAHTRDISRSGLCLISAEGLPLEKEIGIELVLKFGEGGLSEPLHVVGKVVWSTALFGQFQIGVMFVKVDEEQARNLHMFIGFLDGSLNAGELFGGDEETTDKPNDPDDPFGA